MLKDATKEKKEYYVFCAEGNPELGFMIFMQKL